MPFEKKTSYKKFNDKGKTTLNREPLTLNRKRRRLAPLMTEEAKATASIHELSYDFGSKPLMSLIVLKKKIT
jgi:hypothetical protein